MKKEILFAILLGLSMGLIITYGFYRARIALLASDPQKILQASPTPSPSPSDLSNLVIVSPVDESVQNSSAVTVAGTTAPNRFVVIFINNKETITTADESGNFSISAELEIGSNVIAIHSLDENGQTTMQEVTVIHLNDEQDTNSASISASPNPNTKVSPSPSARATTRPTPEPAQ